MSSSLLQEISQVPPLASATRVGCTAFRTGRMLRYACTFPSQGYFTQFRNF